MRKTRRTAKRLRARRKRTNRRTFKTGGTRY